MDSTILSRLSKGRDVDAEAKNLPAIGSKGSKMIDSLRSQLGEVAKARDDANSSAFEKGRRARMFESRFGLLADELD